MADPVAAAAPAAAPAPTPAAAAPGAATPAPAAPGAPPATPTPADGAKPGEPGAAPANIVADAGKPAGPVEPTKEERAAYLTGKGIKAEELAKLDEAGIKTKFEELKAADAKAEAVSKIEIKVPEGAVIDEKSMSAFKEILAEAKVPTEQAQKLFDMHSAALQGTIESSVNLWMDTQAKWQAEIKADAEMGGTNLPKVSENISKVLDHFVGPKGSKERQAVDEAFVLTGAGNNPAIVRCFNRVGSAFGEGKLVSGSPLGAAKGDVNEAAKQMYPSASDGVKAN